MARQSHEELANLNESIYAGIISKSTFRSMFLTRTNDNLRELVANE